MTVIIKELIVVCVIAALVFRLAKAPALQFSAAADFVRRRNVWFILTIVGFLSPSFWIYVLIGAPLLYWAGRKDANPIALYVLVMHAIPDVPVEIPTIAIKQLFGLDNYRLLSFCVLIPLAWRIRKARAKEATSRLTAMDYLVFAFGLLQLLHYVPPDLPGPPLQDSATNVLRRSLLFFIDIYVLYYVVSRSCTSRKVIIEVMAAFCLSGAIMALIGVFESVRHWLLYNDMIAQWGQQVVSGYSYMRAGFIRAQTSAGHPIALGYLLAIALGFWLYVRSALQSRSIRLAGTLVLCAGLAATGSRGPWAGAILIYFSFAALGRQAAFSRIIKAAAVLSLFVAAMSLTTAGQKVIDSLPLLGTTEDSSTIYRDRLAERSWELIQQHPLLGDPLVLQQMQDLRQGEGIIDLVNTYAETALFYGLLGVAIFIAFILIALRRTYRAMRRAAATEPELALLGASLVATILGVLFMLANSSFILGIPIMYYILGGLASGYVTMLNSGELRPASDTRQRAMAVPAHAPFRPVK